MKSMFGRHRVRAHFYHLVSTLYLWTMTMWWLDVISDSTSTWIGATLFFVDYVAEMYDPNPDNPGPWFQAHFHRFLDNKDD